MELFAHTYHIYRRNLRVWLAQPIAVAGPLLQAAFMYLLLAAPLSQVTQLAGFPSDDYFAFVTSMVIVMTVVFSGIDAAAALLTDMMSGYFDKLLLAPVNRFAILLGALLVAATRSLGQVVIIVVISLIFGVDYAGGVLGIVAVIVAGTAFGLAIGCLGLIVALWTKSIQVTQSLYILFMPIAFLTTAFMPRELMTGWFKTAVLLNPVDYILVGIRTIVVTGWEWGPILTALWILVGMTTAMLAFSAWVFRRATV